MFTSKCTSDVMQICYITCSEYRNFNADDKVRCQNHKQMRPHHSPSIRVHKGRGKVDEKILFKAREKSGNFKLGQGILLFCGICVGLIMLMG